MPIYQYQCKRCNSVSTIHKFEYNPTPSTYCNSCQNKEILLVFTPPFIHYKGDGFYSTRPDVIAEREKKTKIFRQAQRERELSNK